LEITSDVLWHVAKLLVEVTKRTDEGAQTSEYLIHDYKLLEKQRKTLKHQIKTSGGTWPTTNSDCVTTYSHAFARFIKS
jgi:hypothetical protein